MAESSKDQIPAERWEFWKSYPLPDWKREQADAEVLLEARRAQLNGDAAVATLKEVLETFERFEYHQARILTSALEDLKDCRRSGAGLAEPFGRYAEKRLSDLVEGITPDPGKDSFPSIPVGFGGPTGAELNPQIRTLLERWHDSNVMEAVNRRRDQSRALQWTVDFYLGGGGFQRNEQIYLPKIRPFNDPKVMKRFAQLVLEEEPEDHAESRMVLGVVETAMHAKADPLKRLSQPEERVLMKLISRAESEVGGKSLQAQAEEPGPEGGM